METKTFLSCPFILSYFILSAVGSTLHGPTINGNNDSENTEVRIIGGEAAFKNEFPWMVYLSWKNSNGETKTCGGSVISNYWVMTAGLCVLDVLNGYSDMTIVAGVNNRSFCVNEPGRQQRESNTIILHPRFYTLSGAPMNDIALIKIHSPLNATGSVKPIKLPPAEMINLTSDAVVLGWGMTNPIDTNSVSEILQKANVTISNLTACKNVYNNNGHILVTDNMMCTSFENRGPCNKDAGGPLVCLLGNIPYVCGIVSWKGEKCADASYPDVYTRVTSYNSWIQSVISAGPNVLTSLSIIIWSNILFVVVL